MDLNYPSINIKFINELTTIFDELKNFRISINKLEKDIDDYKKKQNEDNIENLNNKIQEQEKKIDIIHTLFNKLRELNQQDEIISNVLNSDKIKYLDENLYDIKNIYESYNNLCISSNKIIEKTYNKLEELNKNIIKSNDRLEKYNIKFNEITKKQDEKIRDLELQNNKINEQILLKN